jgi:hypothetical protein
VRRRREKSPKKLESLKSPPANPTDKKTNADQELDPVIGDRME